MKETIVAVIDGGGRGSALVDTYARSPYVHRLIAIPGNDLMKINTDKSVIIYPQLKTTSIPEIVQICEDQGVTLVDVAQDNAVASGLVDSLLEKHIQIVGPTRSAGEIEWSKIFCRRFGERHGIAQPRWSDFQTISSGIRFLNSQADQAWFIKADGLAEGKGVLPAKGKQEAMKRLPNIRRFGKPATRYLIEEWLKGDDGSLGEEFSSFIIIDGENFKFIGHAQDHKRANNFDEGENTGGMGCVTHPLVLNDELIEHVRSEIMQKAVKGLAEENRPYTGILYLGGILVKRKGIFKPYVIEFNARWGDPEAQVILPGLTTDLFELGLAVSEGNIKQTDICFDGKSRVVVAGVSRGYPENYDAVKGKRIHGLEEIMKMTGIKLYGAGVKEVDGKYFASGGRLFYIVGEGIDIIEARKKAYEAMSLVHIEGNNLHYRTDIAWRDIERKYLKYDIL